jgi:GTP-binding protein
MVDTAGVRRPRSQKEPVEIFSVQASTRAIRNADVVFLCIASHEPISDQDMRLLSLAEREGRPTAVLLNFWDRLGPAERKHFMEDTEFAPYLRKFRVLPMSGLTGLNAERCLPLAFRLFRQSRRRVRTSKLNRMVDNIISHNPPPTAGKQNFNILYASQVKVNPPTFVFFMNRKGNLPMSYQRYLENRLKKDLGFQGQTVRVFFRGERDSR